MGAPRIDAAAASWREAATLAHGIAPRAPLASGGVRWAGRGGPSGWMTAVERRGATAADRSRSEREQTGARVDRVARMTAEERGLAGLDPPVSRGEMLAAVPGLDPRTNSAQGGTPHGFRGLTVAGRRAVRDGAGLMAADPGTVVFLTATLPPDVAETCTREQLARFQSRLLFFVRRALVAVGLEPLAVLVAEIHPHRRTLAGGPIVHWHAAIRGRNDPGDPWGLPLAQWRRVVSQAHRSAFGHHRRDWRGCRVEAARQDPGRYLSKYLSKGSSDPGRFKGTQWERCIPRQWWSWTGELRALVQGARWRPPSGFLRHCCRWRDDLQAAELAESGEIVVGDGMTVGVWFRWRDLGALVLALESWALEEDWREGQIRGGPSG
jgi:hypothetical protein